MFKQIKDLAGGEFYLIASLLIFMVFFVMVGIYLFQMKRGHIIEMSNLPISEPQPNNYEEV